jgi:hypothetical protein
MNVVRVFLALLCLSAASQTQAQTTVTLRAANGLYVAAEQGGGVDPRVSGEVAIRANRAEAHEWETFKVVPQANGYIALQTDSNHFITAEQGGGSFLRTNATEVNAWELFTPIQIGSGVYALAAIDGHIVCAEVGSPDPVVNATRTAIAAWEQFVVTVTTQPTTAPPSHETVMNIRANFASMRDSQGRTMLSWFWPMLDARTRTEWLQRYRGAGYTHLLLCPVMQYPGYWVPWGDLRNTPARFADYVQEAVAAGFSPIIEMTSGDGGSAGDIDRYWPGLLAELNRRQLLPYTWLSPGFETVGPGGGWSSAELSKGLIALHQLAPAAHIMVHLQPERATGASHPVEPDDPWQGDEAGFWTSNGGQFAEALFYQTPHGGKLLDRAGTAPGVAGWEDRWIEVLDRLGIGARGWRKVYLVLGEKTAFDYYRDNATDNDVTYTSAAGARHAAARGVVIGFGDGR